MSIQNELDKIKNAVYGKEVRGAIHDGIKKTYDDASKNGNANMEVEMARGTEETLNDRLQKMDTRDKNLTDELLRKPNINDVRKNTNDVPINVSEMDTETKQLFTGGAVAVVGENAVGTENLKLKSVTPSITTFVDNKIPFELEVGSISNGDKVPFAPTRIRLKEKIENPLGVNIKRKTDSIMYGISTYSNGVFDGGNTGWLDLNEYYVNPKKDILFNVMKKDGTAFTNAEISNPSDLFEITFNFKSADVHTVNKIKEELDKNLYSDYQLKSSDFEYGSYTGNVPSGYTENRVRTKRYIKVSKGAIITFEKNPAVFYYGVSLSNLDGTHNGDDYGWLEKKSFVIPHDGLLLLSFRYIDNRDITDFFSDTQKTFSITKTLKDEIYDLKEAGIDSDKKQAINSITIENGRLNGATYVFVRIPKTTLSGHTLKPKVALTSSDGTISGPKTSTLGYARRENTILSVNAGLFNITTTTPVGQLILNGVSIINEPMESDNGVPIHPDECYPLAIDSNGNFKTYPRNVDTSTMIADGIKYAVVGWGKLVDNFEISNVDIQNEIVHGGSKKYMRQSIGQFQNGDYFVCTVDNSRGPVVNESGLTYMELAQLLVDKGVKFAYSLDGGGSSQTVIGKRQINPIYEGTIGRGVPTVISFELDY